MPFSLAEALPMLTGLGFTYQPPPPPRPGEFHPFERMGVISMESGIEPWRIHCALGGSLGNSYPYLDFGLVNARMPGGGMIGPQHRVYSLASLFTAVPRIRELLGAFAADESQLHCPTCKLRWLEVKEPHEGQRWRAFLSCSGMQVVQQRMDGVRVKGIACRGARNDIAAIVVYQ